MMHDRYPMGRIPIPDPRDEQYPLQALMPRTVERQPYQYYATGPILDQGRTNCPHCNSGRHPYCCQQGFCVGAAWKQWLASEIIHLPDVLSMIGIYHRAQEYDQWPGAAASYAGSSVRGGADALRLHFGNPEKIITRYHWARNMDSVLDWLLGGLGCLVAGSVWYESMFDPDEDGFIRPAGRIAGGHAYLLNGANAQEEKVRITNSWGTRWGDSGRAWIRFADLERLLFRENGEVCGADLSPTWAARRG